MQIIRMREVEGKINQRGVEAKLLIQHENAKVMNLVLQPGNVIPEHKVPVNVFFYVVQGKGTIKIGSEESVVRETDIILCPPNTEMSLRADQNDTFVVLNVKTPSF